jgi:hypothetical protein
VLFAAELAFERVRDGFDPLAHARQAPLGGAGGRVGGVLAGGPDQVDVEVVEELLECLPGEARSARITYSACTRWWSTSSMRPSRSRRRLPGRRVGGLAGGAPRLLERTAGAASRTAASTKPLAEGEPAEGPHRAQFLLDSLDLVSGQGRNERLNRSGVATSQPAIHATSACERLAHRQIEVEGC